MSKVAASFPGRKHITHIDMEAGIIYVTCPFCKAANEVKLVKVTDYEQFEAWLNGVHIQRALPELTSDDRELLISGTCSRCWDEMLR